MGFMRDRIGDAAMLEQLAEECAELGKASLKMARIIRNENPTPVTATEAQDAIIEEYTDIRICATELGLYLSPTIARAKRERFEQRWKDFQDE